MFPPGHGPSPATVLARLPTVLPLSPDGFGADAAAHLCTGCMGELSAYFCCQMLYFKSRRSVTRNSEKKIGSQIVEKNTAQKKTLLE